MPIQPDRALPKTGDLVEYSCHRGTVTLRVAFLNAPSEDAGYSDVYFDGCVGPTFNINWTTLNANTGTWRIVPERKKPRKFQVPHEPEDLECIQAMDGTDVIYQRDGALWKHKNGNRFTWWDLLTEHDGLLEVFESPYEKAIKFFKAGTSLDESAPLDAFAHARAIIQKAIEEV